MTDSTCIAYKADQKHADQKHADQNKGLGFP